MPALSRSEHEAGVPVFLQFSFRQGWFCEFLKEDRRTRLPRTVMLPDERKLFELVKRGGFTLNISGRQEIENAIRKKRGGVWLELTPEQYAKLRQPAANLDKITSSFPRHVLRLLVIAQGDKARVPEVIVRRPLREFELPDEDRLHPATVLHLRRRQSYTPPATSRLG